MKRLTVILIFLLAGIGNAIAGDFCLVINDPEGNPCERQAINLPVTIGQQTPVSANLPVGLTEQGLELLIEFDQLDLFFGDEVRVLKITNELLNQPLWIDPNVFSIFVERQISATPEYRVYFEWNWGNEQLPTAADFLTGNAPIFAADDTAWLIIDWQKTSVCDPTRGSLKVDIDHHDNSNTTVTTYSYEALSSGLQNDMTDASIGLVGELTQAGQGSLAVELLIEYGSALDISCP